MPSKKLSLKFFSKILIVLIISLLGAGVGYVYFLNSPKFQNTKQVEKNTPKAFISEIYDKVKENYWNNISDSELKDLFKLATEKNGGQVNASSAANIAQAVLASLPPVGRSGLYTQKQEIALKNTVENINPDKDLYRDLGIQKGASLAAIEKAFQDKSKEASEEELKQLTYAKDILTKEDTKQRYDQKGVEPTIFTKVYPPGVLYLQFKKFSPTALDEFQKAFEMYKGNDDLHGLILDLRGNVGGAIDSTANFLGFFLGKNQSAFEFYKKGEYLPFRTPTDKLASLQKYKQMVVLIDQNTQSSAEMMAASMKKYHLGVLIGTTTKGWGSVERVFPLDNQISSTEKYSIFLVHSITLRDDNQPIEGRGVEPDINIKSQDWESQLFNYFRNQQLIQAVKTML